MKGRLWLCAALLLAAGCMKDTGETVLLPVRVGEVPESVLPSALRAGLEQWMPIHEGTKPPAIGGGYRMSPMRIVHASDGYDGPVQDMELLVGAQDWWNRTSLRERQEAAGGEGREAWVVGDRQGFTLYTVEEAADEGGGWTCRVVTLLSGRLTEKGIADCRMAMVMLDKRDPEGALVEPASWRVFADGDGLAAISNTAGL